MRGLDYQQIILKGIKDLPPQRLAEIANFITFIRKRTLNPEFFEETFEYGWISRELAEYRDTEWLRLESEFESYKTQYPHD